MNKNDYTQSKSLPMKMMIPQQFTIIVQWSDPLNNFPINIAH